jgi:hypothetical protein
MVDGDPPEDISVRQDLERMPVVTKGGQFHRKRLAARLTHRACYQR